MRYIDTLYYISQAKRCIYSLYFFTIFTKYIYIYTYIIIPNDYINQISISFSFIFILIIFAICKIFSLIAL